MSAEIPEESEVELSGGRTGQVPNLNLQCNLKSSC